MCCNVIALLLFCCEYCGIWLCTPLGHVFSGITFITSVQSVFNVFVSYIQGCHASWKVLDFFSLKFQDLESPGKSLWSWKVLEKYHGKLRIFYWFYWKTSSVYRDHVNKFIRFLKTSTVNILLHATVSAIDYTTNVGVFALY